MINEEVIESQNKLFGSIGVSEAAYGSAVVIACTFVFYDRSNNLSKLVQNCRLSKLFTCFEYWESHEIDNDFVLQFFSFKNPGECHSFD